MRDGKANEKVKVKHERNETRKISQLLPVALLAPWLIRVEACLSCPLWVPSVALRTLALGLMMLVLLRLAALWTTPSRSTSKPIIPTIKCGLLRLLNARPCLRCCPNASLSNSHAGTDVFALGSIRLIRRLRRPTLRSRRRTSIMSKANEALYSLTGTVHLRLLMLFAILTGLHVGTNPLPMIVVLMLRMMLVR